MSVTVDHVAILGLGIQAAHIGRFVDQGRRQPDMQYAIPTWTKTVALVGEHVALRLAITQWSEDVYTCYRFATKLRTYDDLLAACIDRVIAALHVQHPDMGANVAIDGSVMPAYANGQRFLSKNGPERER